MILITPHFRVSEFDCKDGTPYPQEWIEERLQPLANALERIRSRLGEPINIVSGYRSPNYNERLRTRGLRGERGKTGVVQGSQHTEGRAADIMAVGVLPEQLHGTIIAMCRAGELPEIGGVGLYATLGFVHVDTMKASDGHLRRWKG